MGQRAFHSAPCPSLFVCLLSIDLIFHCPSLFASVHASICAMVYRFKHLDLVPLSCISQSSVRSVSSLQDLLIYMHAYLHPELSIFMS